MSRHRPHSRLLVALIGLFLSWWQQRDRGELAEMIEALLREGWRNTPVLMADIVVGALDARRYPAAMTVARPRTVPVLRRGLCDRFVVATVLTAGIVRANVASGRCPMTSVPDPWGTFMVVAGYLGVCS
jgi:hypothetical protein